MGPLEKGAQGEKIPVILHPSHPVGGPAACYSETILFYKSKAEG